MTSSSSGERELLRGALQSLYLSPGWDGVLDSAAAQLKSFEPRQSNREVSAELIHQLVLDAVGSDLRRRWGQEKEYNVALLREPYLQSRRRAELSESVVSQVQHRVDELLAEGECKQKLDAYVVEADTAIERLLDWKRQAVAEKAAAAAELNRISPGLRPTAGDSFQDTVGKALVLTLRKKDYIASLLSNIVPSEGDARPPSTTGGAAAPDNMGTSMESILSGSDAEVTEVTEGFSAAAIEDISQHLRGTLLNAPLRSALWGFGFLTRGFMEAPVGASNMRELARLAQIKGYKLGDTASSPIADLVARTVAATIQSAFPATAASSALGTLARRAEILVHAAYVLTNVFSDRVVAVAVLLMRVFPLDAPVSEKVLKMFTRITGGCLPSELLHREYSTASVAQETWKMLLARDPQLHEFLQNSSRVDGDDEAASVSRSIPQSLLCLKGWLETGFLGWIPEHAALFLWDQLVLEGAKPETFEDLLPVLCFGLLQLLREALLAKPRDQTVVACMQVAGRALRSRDVIAALKGLFV